MKRLRGWFVFLVTIMLLISSMERENVYADEKESGSESESEVSLSMVGDVLLHLTVVYSAQDSKGNYNFKPIFSKIKKTIKSYDISIVNQETILGGKKLGITGYPMFNAPYEIGDAVADVGFDIVLHANNHALDRGKKGIFNTLNFWRKNYPELAILGIYDNKKESGKIYVHKKNGIKIAILNYTYGTNGLKPPANMPYAVNYLNEKKVVADIQRAKKISDFVIVCPHWGTEYSYGISDYQKYWTNVFLKNKVDLVIGTHPHVIEPIKWVKDKKSGHKMLVYYSLGNFLNGTIAEDALGDRYLGGMAEVVISKKEGEKAKIKDYGVVAIVNHRENKKNGFKLYKLADYSEKLIKKHAIRSQHSGFNMKYCVDLCNKLWGKLWK